MKSFLFFIMLVLSSFITNPPSEYGWDKNYKVQISDFQLDENMPSNKLMEISTGIYFLNINGRKFSSVAMANRKLSRMSKKVYGGYRVNELLAHEQIHFDITEYVSRLLNFRLRDVTDPVIANRVYNQHLNLLDDIQMIYDAQTNHSNDLVWQKKWRDNMDRLLSKEIPLENWKMYPY